MSQYEPFRIKYPAYIPPEAFTLDDKYFRIYAVIDAIIGGEINGFCYLTNEQIAEATNKGKSTVARAIAELDAMDLIWIDSDRQRPLKKGSNKDRAIRRIYTNYKYYKNRNKKPTLPKKFKNKYAFKNYLKAIEHEFTFKFDFDGRVIPLKVTKKGLIFHTGTDKYLNKNDDKELIDKAWDFVYENKDEVLKTIKKGENDD